MSTRLNAYLLAIILALNAFPDTIFFSYIMNIKNSKCFKNLHFFWAKFSNFDRLYQNLGLIDFAVLTCIVYIHYTHYKEHKRSHRRSLVYSMPEVPCSLV